MSSAEESQQSLAIVRSALEHIEEGISVVDANLRLVALNERCLEILDFPVELSIPGTDFADFMRYNAERGEYGEGDIEELVAERVTQAKKFEPHSFERVRPDGTVIRVTGTPLPEGGFVSVFKDVTTERQREAELERRVQSRTTELRQNETRFSLIANEVTAGIVLLDTNLVFKYVNRGFSQPYGVTPESILDKQAQEVLSPKTFKESLPRFNKALAGESVQYETEEYLFDDRRLIVRCYLRPEISDDGQVTGFYLLIVDMTRQRESDLALIRAQKMEALGTMSAGIAHDFNNLLTIILGNLNPLEEAMSDDRLRQEYLEPAIAAASRGNDLTTRLLSLTKQTKSVPQPIKGSDAISSTLKILSASLPSDIQLKGPDGPQTHWIRVDRGQLEMALINLAVNASEAISGPGQIAFSCGETVLEQTRAQSLKVNPGRYFQIKVSDTGHGMSEDVAQRIFDPFYSRKPDKGSGLGLAMVYAFAEMSGGAISVTSKVDKGTTFTLYLPLMDPQDEEAGQSDVEEEGKADLEGMHVLLVEDNSLVRDVMRRQLQALGAQISEVGSAEEAVELINSEASFALVLSDISLTGKMTGIDLRGVINKQRADLPVILMTAHGAGDVVGPDTGTGQVLQKPFKNNQLEKALLRALSPGP
ncbi:PAS-domain containing protein [Thalassovita sp.]|uniref:hybrid sensor histidine kinase/response regulator n=1 Tax=Thalassovita sp. TaxID=1979401 RepID=UPI002B27AFC0|nr:PAS-domain containing protein [Thalassovita sp.]